MRLIRGPAGPDDIMVDNWSFRDLSRAGWRRKEQAVEGKKRGMQLAR